MPKNNDACLRCGASLSLIERWSLESAVQIPGKGSICPGCYRDLSSREYDNFFKD